MSEQPTRTRATRFCSNEQVLTELDRLKFAVAALASGFPAGSHEHENAQNASRGIAARLDYLYDSVSRLHERSDK